MKAAGRHLALALAAMLAWPAAADGRSLQVVATNFPLAWFARSIGADAVTVGLPVPADVDPAFHVPDINAIHTLQQADLVLMNGAGYEPWQQWTSLPFNATVLTTEEGEWLAAPGAAAHSHGPGEAHSHGGVAFTTWLDMSLAARQAQRVADALARRLPAQAALLGERAAAIIDELLALDARQGAAVARDPARPLLASHPVYQYLAERHGLNLEALHWEPDQLPAEAEWQALEALQTGHGARHMLWEAAPLPAVRERLAGMGIAVHIVEPAFNPGPGADFIEIMRANTAALEAAFR